MSSFTVIRILVGMFAAVCETQPIRPRKFDGSVLWPKTSTFPLSARRTPNIVRRRVVFPPPFGPTIPTNSPFLISRSMPSKTSLPDLLTNKSATEMTD